jgi:hypothetical protein
VAPWVPTRCILSAFKALGVTSSTRKKKLGLIVHVTTCLTTNVDTAVHIKRGCAVHGAQLSECRLALSKKRLIPEGRLMDLRPGSILPGESLCIWGLNRTTPFMPAVGLRLGN